MRENRCFAGDLLQGLLSFGILYYIVAGDVVRYPETLLGPMPRGLLNSSKLFLLYMLVMFYVEGSRAAQDRGEGGSKPVRRALAYYIPYWRVCVPLTVLGYALFCVPHGLPVYTPMFENPSPLNLARGAVALTNNLHEGAWLVPCLALCAFFAALSSAAGKRWGRAMKVATLFGSVITSAVLFLVVIPFHYHSMVYRAAAVTGPCAFVAGVLTGGWPMGALEGRKPGNAVQRLTAPIRFVGRHWVAFWLLQFYVAYYYYNIPASVYTATGSIHWGYLVILCLCVALLAVLRWSYGRLEEAWERGWRGIVSMLPILAVPFLLRFALEASVDYGRYANRTAGQWPVYAFAAAAALLGLMLLLRALTGRWSLSGAVVTVLATALAIANHYTMKFHGTLLMAEDLRNLRTAANVIGGYDFTPDAVALRVLLFGLGALACCLIAGLLGKKDARAERTKKGRLADSAACLALAVGLECVLYFAPVPVVDRSKNIWNWLTTYSEIGYLNGTVETTLANSGSVMEKPEDYSEERVGQIAREIRDSANATVVATSGEDYPDIVMILNETYYNLGDYIDLSVDRDITENYDALDNGIKGRVLTPFRGGNTNASEYEMLTGNSMTLIYSNAPFNRLNLTGQVSLPNYLSRLGYSTLAAHPENAQNYLRGLRWEQMEFDETYFIDDFSDLEYYAKRKRKPTDVSTFDNLVRFMDEMPEDSPRFAFLLTIQNHGDWITNDPEDALVHGTTAISDGEMSNRIDEFLSCMALTDDFIGRMQAYFADLYEQTGRRVIVCMAGDHSPSFIADLEPWCKWDDEVYAQRAAKLTPYFIWANYPLALDEADLEGTDSMDLTCLMPTLLDVAGLPLSDYYRSLADLRRRVSGITYVAGGYRDEDSALKFMDVDGALHNLSEDSSLAQRVRDYFALEYNLISDGGECPELYLPAA